MAKIGWEVKEHRSKKASEGTRGRRLLATAAVLEPGFPPLLHLRCMRAPQNANELSEAQGLVRRAVREMQGYVPGLQPKPGQRLVKLNTNENPYPPSPRVLDALEGCRAEAVRLYPNPEGEVLREEAARVYGLAPSQVLCGNGSDEILAIVMRAFVDEGDTISYFQPSYSLYPVLASIAAARTLPIALERLSEAGEAENIPVPSPRAKLFFLTTPNAPYGFSFSTRWIARLLESFPGIVVADEAYVDFAPGSALPLLAHNPRLIIARSLSKAYSLAGMRVGLAFAQEAIVAEMMKVKDSYNVSRPAQEAGRAALSDQEYLERTRSRILATRERFTAELRRRGFTVLPSHANFLFAVPPKPAEARMLYEGLLRRGFLVRYFSSPGLSDGVRISIGTEEDMAGLSGAMEEATRGDQQ